MGQGRGLLSGLSVFIGTVGIVESSCKGGEAIGCLCANVLLNPLPHVFFFNAGFMIYFKAPF